MKKMNAAPPISFPNFSMHGMSLFPEIPFSQNSYTSKEPLKVNDKQNQLVILLVAAALLLTLGRSPCAGGKVDAARPEAALADKASKRALETAPEEEKNMGQAA
jgi:hypothetical protein